MIKDLRGIRVLINKIHISFCLTAIMMLRKKHFETLLKELIKYIELFVCLSPELTCRTWRTWQTTSTMKTTAAGSWPLSPTTEWTTTGLKVNCPPSKCWTKFTKDNSCSRHKRDRFTSMWSIITVFKPANCRIEQELWTAGYLPQSSVNYQIYKHLKGAKAVDLLQNWISERPKHFSLTI